MQFFQQIFTGFSLLPTYIIVIAILLVIIPTLCSLILRFFLYQHLHLISKKVRNLLTGGRQENPPKIVEILEQRCQDSGVNLEKINTLAIIEGVYSQEKFVLGGLLQFRCEQIDYFTRILPNLLLAFGLLGTFLGITINLANLSQTISQVDINDVRSLVAELNQPLQGMGIAFITSLIAVACSSFLTVINFTWNTTLTKSLIFSTLEDYLDNVYLPQLTTPKPLEEAVDALGNKLTDFLEQFTQKIENAIAHSIGSPMADMVAENKRVSALAEQVYQGFTNASTTMEKSSNIFRKAAYTLEESRMAEKIAEAITDLAIAQNQFSQSSLMLKKSTQSMEHTLQAMQSSIQKILEIGEEINSLNEKYATIVTLTEKRNGLEETGLKEIQAELVRLVTQLQEIQI